RLGFTESLADLMEDPIATLLDGGSAIAANAQLRSFVRAPTEEQAGALSAVLTALIAAPEALSVEILDSSGNLLLHQGDDLPPSPVRAPGVPTEMGISPIYDV